MMELRMQNVRFLMPHVVVAVVFAVALRGATTTTTAMAFPARTTTSLVLSPTTTSATTRCSFWTTNKLRGGGGGHSSSSSQNHRNNVASTVVKMSDVATATADDAIAVAPSSSFSSSAAVAVPTTTNNDTAETESALPPFLVKEEEEQQQQQVLIKQSQEVVQRWQRSGMVAGACVATWMLAKICTIVQASAIVGILSCLLPSPTMAAASFCGSFAGMSGQLSNLWQASLLGGVSAMIYYWWDAQKIGVGKGGRLGTIALLSNAIYYVLANTASGGIHSLLSDTIQKFGPATFDSIVASGLALHFVRRCRSASSTGAVEQERKPTRQQNQILLAATQVISKVALLASLAVRMRTASVDVAVLAKAASAIFASSWIVKKSPGVVLPVALLGLVGSVTPWAAPIYLGAFLGMTGLKNFGLLQLAQGSVVSACLLSLGIMDGFGGKLGFLSFLGVLFGM